MPARRIPLSRRIAAVAVPACFAAYCLFVVQNRFSFHEVRKAELAEERRRAAAAAAAAEE